MFKKKMVIFRSALAENALRRNVLGVSSLTGPHMNIFNLNNKRSC